MFYQPLDDKIRDFLFQARGPIAVSENISIVEIDEPSLETLGQWPWERNKIAKILDNLNQAGAIIIGLDLFFPEQDKTSPNKIARQFGLDPASLPDYDQILSDSIARTPIVLGYLFSMTPTDREPILLKNNLLVNENKRQSQNFLPSAHSAILNLPIFRDQAIASGFLNYLPDESGIIRSIPLMMTYQDKVYSSMAFELFRLLNESPPITINTAPTGITSLALGDQQIVTDAHGKLQLQFYGPSGSFEYLSAHDIYKNEFDRSKIKDRIVLIGSTAAGLKDIRATPFDATSSGVEVHATALENLLRGDYIFRPDWMPGADIAILLGIALLTILIYPFASAYIMFLLMMSGLYLIYLAISQVLFKHGVALNIIFPLIALVLFTISSTLINYYRESGLKKKIKESFSKKVSASVVDDILKNSHKDILIGHSKEITIFFSDISDFTLISEKLGEAHRVIDLLNVYMTPMVEDITEASGTVDKLIGDSIMAYWNAPHSVPSHPDQAVAASLRQLYLLKAVNKTLKLRYQLEIDISIGINTGSAIVGEMGSIGRSDYTAIGDSVNLAARLGGLCKVYGCRIIISEFTHQQLTQSWPIRELDWVRVKGKHQAVRIFEVLEPEIREMIDEHEWEAYPLALLAYQQGDFKEAHHRFVTLNRNNPSRLYQLYTERCQHFLAKPPLSFDGVFTVVTK